MTRDTIQKRKKDAEDLWDARMNELEEYWHFRMDEARSEYRDQFIEVTRKRLESESS